MFSDLLVFKTPKLQRAQMVLALLQLALKKANLIDDAKRLEGLDLTNPEMAKVALEILNAMRALGRAIQGGDDHELLHWVVPGVLAVAHRPLRYHPLHGGSRLPLPADAAPLVVEWAELLQVEGIKSIISLMHHGDTACYRSLSLGDRVPRKPWVRGGATSV